MKERPILFNGPMVRAILDGRKTQTRRVIKGMTDPIDYPQLPGVKCVNYRNKGTFWFGVGESHPHGIEKACPHGQPGDRLWLRETWAVGTGHGDNEPLGPDNCAIIYRASWNEDCPGVSLDGAWKPSIHMPRWASRITLEITGVRVERLNHISNMDILREGIREEACNVCVHTGGSGCEHCFAPLNGFKRIWKSINGPESWDANPWVWVVEFKRVEV